MIRIEYWMFDCCCDVCKSNAIRVFSGVDAEEEAIKSAREFREEILAGVYDEEWEMEPKQREDAADDVSLYEVWISGAGIKKREQIGF